VLRLAVVLVSLGDDRVVLENQKPRGAMRREVVVQSKTLGLESVAARRLCCDALERSDLWASRDLACRKHLVEVTDQTDEAARFRPSGGSLRIEATFKRSSETWALACLGWRHYIPGSRRSPAVWSHQVGLEG
jgi:hypothetical protein